MRMNTYLPLLAMLTALSCSAAAQEPATGILAERMDAMRAMKNDMKVIDEMLTGKKHLSRKRLTLLLDQLAGYGGAKLVGLFPEGSHGHPSEAAPAIWQSLAEFEKLAGEMKSAAEAMANGNAAEATMPDLQAAFKTLSATCKSCHERFRL